MEVYVFVTPGGEIELFTDLEAYQRRVVNVLRDGFGMTEVAADWTFQEFPEDRDEIESAAIGAGFKFQTAEFVIGATGTVYPR